MKKIKGYLNKGISSMVAILIIVIVGVVIVGGVLAYQYYWQPEKSSVENTNRNPQSIITILSPNGGEIFNQGQDISIKWASRGIDNVYISAYYFDTNGNIGNPELDEYTFNNGECRLTYEPISAASGQYIIKKDFSGRCGKLPIGSRIKIEVSEQGTNIKDLSDNYFSIIGE